MSSVTPSISNDSLIQAFSFLKPAEEIGLRQVCKRWNTLIATDDPRWKIMGKKIQASISCFRGDFKTNETSFSSVREFCFLTHRHFPDTFTQKMAETLNDMDKVLLLAIPKWKNLSEKLEDELEKALETNADVEPVLQKIADSKCKVSFDLLTKRLNNALKNKNAEQISLVLNWMSIVSIAPSITQLFNCFKENPDHAEAMYRVVEKFNPEMFKSFVLGWTSSVIQNSPKFVPLILEGMKKGGIIPERNMIMVASSHCPQYIPAILDAMLEVKQISSTYVFEHMLKNCSEFVPHLLEAMKKNNIVPEQVNLLAAIEERSEHLPVILEMMKSNGYIPHPVINKMISEKYPSVIDQSKATT